VFIYTRTVTDLTNGPAITADNVWLVSTSLTQLSPTVDAASNFHQFGNTVSITTSAVTNVKYVMAVGSPRCEGTVSGTSYTTGCVYIYTAGTFTGDTITYQTYASGSNSVNYVRINALRCKNVNIGNGPNLAMWSAPAPTSGALTTGSVSLAIGTPYDKSEAGSVSVYQADKDGVWDVSVPAASVVTPTPEPSNAPTFAPTAEPTQAPTITPPATLSSKSAVTPTGAIVGGAIGCVLAIAGFAYFYTLKRKQAATAAAARSGLDNSGIERQSIGDIYGTTEKNPNKF